MPLAVFLITRMSAQILPRFNYLELGYIWSELDGHINFP